MIVSKVNVEVTGKPIDIRPSRSRMRQLQPGVHSLSAREAELAEAQGAIRTDKAPGDEAPPAPPPAGKPAPKTTDVKEVRG